MALAATRTLADRLKPVDRADARLYNVMLIVGGSLLIALTARIAIPAWPVPITAQTFGVCLVAGLLGSRRAVAAVALYLAQGALGFPVFAQGAGVAYMLGPTGGYLAGFLVAAWIIGRLAERGWDRSLPRCFLAMLLGHAVILACGTAWLWVVGDSIAGAIVAGFTPFIVGSVVKSAAAAPALALGWRLARPRA